MILKALTVAGIVLASFLIASGLTWCYAVWLGRQDRVR